MGQDVPWTAIEVVGERWRDDPGIAALRTAVRVGLERTGGSVAGTDELTAVSLEHADTVIAYGDGAGGFQVARRIRGLQSLVLVRCEVAPEDLDLVADASETAVLTLADPADRERLAGAVAGHLASRHESSDLVVEPFDHERASEVICSWLAACRNVAATVEEVSIETSDGWILGADLHLPATADSAPAVVLMHTGRSDRVVFDRLAAVMARRGVAALALDWRGRGVSTNLGHFVDFTSEQQRDVRLDVTASYDYLERRPEIDGRRLAVLGIAHGAGYGLDGALGDERTRALGVMTAYHLLDDRQRAELESGAVAVLCVACTPNTLSAGAMREICAASPNRSSRLIEYPEGVLGYQLFDLHPDLEPTIAQWFAEVLAS